MQKLWWMLPGVALAMGCGEELTPDPSLPVGEVSRPIFGGEPPDAPEHGAVIGIHSRSGDRVSVSPFCSGTLITPDVILTAAHCLDTAKGGSTFRTAAPSSVAVYLGGEEAASDPAPLFIGVSETLIHPSYNRQALRNDIALMRLSSPAPAAIAPVAALPAALGFRAADVGIALDFAGFGDTEAGTFGVLLHTIAPLGGLGCTVAGCGSPGDAATQISYVQYENGPCFGDSGGPAFISRNGTPYVAGVTSYGDSRCTLYGVSTRVDAFEGFISDFAAAGGGGAGGAGGEGGGGGAACGDGVCDVGESCDGRAGTTACASDCAGRTGGNPSRRFCYVGPTCEGPGCP